ncbi:MAG: FHA domain-containing protein [Vicinamibacterales bacterium]
MIRKLIIGNGRSEREILLVGSITIGRDPSCHVSEPDPLLSRRHAEIVANVHGVSVRDLDSRNGVLVNGEKTREQVLLPGDLVQMGHLQLRYVEEQPRPVDAHVSRGSDPRRQAPPPPAPPSYDIDRFRPEPKVARPTVPVTPQPGRWKPEPTPLPGRRTTAPPPPPPQRVPPPPPPRAQNFTPVPRGKAAFDDTVSVPRHMLMPERLDQTQVSAPHDTTLGGHMDSTLMAPASRDASTLGSWHDPVDPDATMLAGDVRAFQDPSGIMPGDSTFAAALSHLQGIATPGAELPSSTVAGAQLVANAELVVTAASPGCAELLGIPDEHLIGDSLTDVFLRGVRRAYGEPESTLHFSVARGPRGSITVTLTLDKTSGIE